MPASLPHYPLIHPSSLALAAGILTGRKRSFRRDAQALVARLRPPLVVHGKLPRMADGGWLVVCNHYARPGFRAWWIPLSIASVVPAEMHWVMTSAWTFPDPVRSRILTPLTKRLFGRIAATYAFSSMPPMPPRPEEAQARALAVRAVLAYAKDHPLPVVGLAPEGADSAGGSLARPPQGVGRFLAQLARQELRLLPIGVYEEGGRLHLRIGGERTLAALRADRSDLDSQVSELVMESIAACLPPRLRGPYQGVR